MIPHPPMIVPEIGRGSEAQIRKTTLAYARVAGEAAALRPDTLIITSPYSVMDADYFHISPGGAEGSFRRFRAPGVKFSECYDEVLVERICALADEEGLLTGTLGEKDADPDHGTMVQLWLLGRSMTGESSCGSACPGCRRASTTDWGCSLRRPWRTPGISRAFSWPLA